MLLPVEEFWVVVVTSCVNLLVEETEGRDESFVKDVEVVVCMLVEEKSVEGVVVEIFAD